MPRRPTARPPAPPPLPAIHLSRDYDRSLVAWHRREGHWVKVRPGASIDAAALNGPSSARVLALAGIAALLAQLTTDVVFSHTSAALLWDLPTERTPELTHVIEPGRARPDASPHVYRHRHRLRSDHVTTVHGVPVTSLERTVVDCATSESAAGGVIVADAALHRRADRRVCEQILAGMVGHRGVVRARAVLEAADDGAESAAESLVRVTLLAAGLPSPQTQVAVRTHLGTFWADLGWPEHRVLLEYDGRGKYSTAPMDVVLAEKRREDALLDAGWLLIRLTAEDLRDPDGLVRRVLQLLPTVQLHPQPLLAAR